MKDIIFVLLYIVLFWMICGVLVMEGYWCLDVYVFEGIWSFVVWVYVYGVLFVLLVGVGWCICWFVVCFECVYLLWGVVLLVVLLWLWSLVSVVSDGNVVLLFYLLIFNLLDVV